MAKIKITGDTSEIRKSLLDLSRDVKSLGKSKVSIFSKEQQDFISSEAKNSIKEIRKEMEKNNQAIKDAVKEQNKVKKSIEEEHSAREKVLKLLKEQVELQKTLSSLEAGSPGAPKGVLGGLGGVLGKGAGGLASRLGLGGLSGGLGIGGLALGGLGAVAAGGMFAYSRASQARDVFAQGVDDRLLMRGRGMSDLAPNNINRAAAVGMNAQSLRRARLGAIDIFGRGGASQESVLRRAEFERGFGIQQGTLQGLGGTMRGALGGQRAEKATMTIQAGLISSGITDEIGPYLETAANMLTSLNENGFAFNDSAMAAFNSLIANSGLGPERASKLITGVDQAIKRSSGEQQAFLQQAFLGAGVGGGSILGTQAGMKMGGLFGTSLDEKSMGKTSVAAFKELGIGNRTGQKVSSQLVNMLDTMFGSPKEIQKGLRSVNKDERQRAATSDLMKNQMIMRTFGLSDQGEAARVQKMLRELADPGTSERRRSQIKKNIKDIGEGNTELGNLKVINESTAGMHNIMKNMQKSIQESLGKKVDPIFTSMDSFLMSIDNSLLSLLGFFGVETPQQKVEKALAGKGVLDKKTLDLATYNDPKKKKQILDAIGGQLEEAAGNIPEMKAAAHLAERGGIGSKASIESRYALQKEDMRRRRFKKSLEQVGDRTITPEEMVTARPTQIFTKKMRQGIKDGSSALDPLAPIKTFLEKSKTDSNGTKTQPPIKSKDTESINLEKQKLQTLESISSTLKRSEKTTRMSVGVNSTESKT